VTPMSAMTRVMADLVDPGDRWLTIGTFPCLRWSDSGEQRMRHAVAT